MSKELLAFKQQLMNVRDNHDYGQAPGYRAMILIRSLIRESNLVSDDLASQLAAGMTIEVSSAWTDEIEELVVIFAEVIIKYLAQMISDGFRGDALLKSISNMSLEIGE